MLILLSGFKSFSNWEHIKVYPQRLFYVTKSNIIWLLKNYNTPQDSPSNFISVDWLLLQNTDSYWENDRCTRSHRGKFISGHDVLTHVGHATQFKFFICCQITIFSNTSLLLSFFFCNTCPVDWDFIDVMNMLNCFWLRTLPISSVLIVFKLWGPS